MLTAALFAEPSTRALTVTDTTALPLPAGAVRVVVTVAPDGRTREVARSSTSVLVVSGLKEGANVLQLRRINALTKTVLDQSNLLPHLAQVLISEQMQATLARHWRRPGVEGNTQQYRRLWARREAIRATFSEGNHSTAAALSRLVGRPHSPVEPINLPLPGLPHVPAGVTFQVDAPQRGLVTVFFDLPNTSALVAQVLPPNGSGAPLQPTITSGTNRASFSFAAPADGLYQVNLSVNGVALTSFLVPVTRLLFAALREDGRALAHAFAGHAVAMSPRYLLRLALLIGHEACAAIGNRPLALRAYAAGLSVPQQAKPIHLFPRP